SSSGPGVDWANSGVVADGDVSCSSLGVTGSGIQHVTGSGGLFDCGKFVDQFHAPIAPVCTAAVTGGTGTCVDGSTNSCTSCANNIDAIAFSVDPEATDQGNCAPTPTRSTICGAGATPCSGGGDPTIDEG